MRIQDVVGGARVEGNDPIITQSRRKLDENAGINYLMEDI